MLASTAIVLMLAAAFPAAAQSRPDTCDGRLAWEQLIIAKGGRERLRAIRTFAVEYFEAPLPSRWFRSSRQTTLWILPEVFWRDADGNRYLWDSLRPFVVIGNSRKHSSSQFSGSEEQYDFFISEFLPETNEHVPEILSCQEAGRSIVVLVQRTLFKSLYYLEKDSHLPWKIVRGIQPRFFPVVAGEYATAANHFYNYKSIDGIMLPTRMQWAPTGEGLEVGADPRKDPPGTVRYQINPPIDPAFRKDPFVRWRSREPWLPAEAKGSVAWK